MFLDPSLQIISHYILRAQRAFTLPDEWCFVEMLVQGEEENTRAFRYVLSLVLLHDYILAFLNMTDEMCYRRTDNLYYTGFTNITGHWHVFKNWCDVIPGSICLPFKDDYGDMVGGADNLVNLPLGGQALYDAVQVQLRTDPGSRNWDEEAVKRAAATISVMVSEAARFPEIREHILKGWETGTRLETSHVKLIRNWTTFSCGLILAQQQGGKWGTDGSSSDEAVILAADCGTKTLEEADGSVSVIIWPRPGRCSADFTIPLP